MDSSDLTNQITIKDKEILSLKEKITELEAIVSFQKNNLNYNELVDVLESMSDAFFAIGSDWSIQLVNSHMERITKVSRDKLLGNSLLDLFFSDPIYQESIYLKSYRKAMKDKIHIHFEDYYEPLNLWTECNVYPKADGGIAIFFSDITREKQINSIIAEDKQKLETIFMNSPAAMALLKGPTFIYEKVNPQYVEMVGERELLGKCREEAFPDLADQPITALLEQVFATGVTFTAREMKVHLIRHKGHPAEDCFFDFSYARVLDGNGNPYGIYINSVDVTDKVLVRKSLESALVYRDNFLSIASHELKTPLTTLKLQGQMNQRIYEKQGVGAFNEAEILKLITNPLAQTERLNHLIEDMLDISRISLEKLRMTFDTFDLSKMLKTTLENFAPQFQNVGIVISSDIKEKMTGNWDAFRLEQVIANIFTNAIKYAPGAPVHVSLKKEKNYVILSVKDNGPGIASDKLAKVFERFERIDVTKNISGMGLGLYISQEIVKQHDGVITVESDYGHGANFIVKLPLNQ